MKRFPLFFIGILLLFVSSSIASAETELFLDVPPDHPHSGAITALHNDGVINGFSDKTFRPDIPVNRAEALKIILLGSNIPEPEPPLRGPFPDVAPEDWFSTFVREAKIREIISGTHTGLFEPTRTINQAEALKLILLTNEIPTSKPEQDPFGGAVSRDDWFAEYYRQAERKFLLTNEEVNPSHELTRGELAEIMYRFADGARSYQYPIGVASYYGDSFIGRKTSSGELLSNDVPAAAHRTLPFGTHILVRDFLSGKAVVVKVIDRGPYVPYRILDLIKPAFSELQDPSRGVTRVEMAVVGEDVSLGGVETLCDFPDEREVIPSDSFEGISLTSDIPGLFRKNEIYKISGSTDSAEEITIFWSDDAGNEKRVTADVENRMFTAEVPFVETGIFHLGILPGKNGTSRVYPVKVLDAVCLTTVGQQPEPVTNLRGEIENGDYVVRWDASSGEDFFRILITQEEKILEVFVNGSHEAFLPPELFENFENGSAEIRVFAADLSSSFSADVSSPFSESEKMKVFVSPHHFTEIDDGRMKDHNFPFTYRASSEMVFSGDFNGEIQGNAFIERPDGVVEEVPLITKGQTFTLQYLPELVGTYIIEINTDGGIAILNAPLYHEGFAPLLPDYFDLHLRDGITQEEEMNVKRIRLMMLKLMNEEREMMGLSDIQELENLTELAQFRSQDMAEKGYFGHTTPEGLTVADFRGDFGINASVGENIAIDVNYEMAHEGLMRSPIHLRNIIDPDWKYAGIGVAPDGNGGLIITELFSEAPLSNADREDYRTQIMNVILSRRTDPLELNPDLTEIAESWAERMGDEEFLGTEAPDGTTLRDMLDGEGIQDNVYSVMYEYESFSEFLDVIASSDAEYLLSKDIETVGIGIAINDNDGLLTVVLLFN